MKPRHPFLPRRGAYCNPSVLRKHGEPAGNDNFRKHRSYNRRHRSQGQRTRDPTHSVRLRQVDTPLKEFPASRCAARACRTLWVFDNNRAVPLLSQPNRPKLSDNKGNTGAALSRSRCSFANRKRKGSYSEGSSRKDGSKYSYCVSRNGGRACQSPLSLKPVGCRWMLIAALTGMVETMHLLQIADLNFEIPLGSVERFMA